MACGVPFIMPWLVFFFCMAVFSLRMDDDEDKDDKIQAAVLTPAPPAVPTILLTEKQKNHLGYMLDTLYPEGHADREKFKKMLDLNSEEFWAQYRDGDVYEGEPCKSESCKRKVVVFGGGPVGLFTGLELARKNYDVSVIENAAYQGLWKQSLEFTRSQILVVQDDVNNKYQSLSRMYKLFTGLPGPDLWKLLLERSCGFVPPPRRGTMNCEKVHPGQFYPNNATHYTSNFKLSISIRELQLILKKGVLAAGGKMKLAKLVSFVDHRGHAFYRDLEISDYVSEFEIWLRKYFAENEWAYCGLNNTLDMNNVEFADCWKRIVHPNTAAMSASTAEIPWQRRNPPQPVAHRIINQLHGDGHPLNCKGRPTVHKSPCDNQTQQINIIWSKCLIHKDTWINIRMATELKPDILICSDGKSGDCRNIVGLDKIKQKSQGLEPHAHKKNGQARAMLFQVGKDDVGMRNLLKMAHNGSLNGLVSKLGTPRPAAEANDIEMWPSTPVNPQNRFRAFPSRYYDDTEEDFYFAATLTEEEFNDYQWLCAAVGKDKCEGYFGWPRSENKQITFEDPCKEIRECTGNQTQTDKCLQVVGRIQGILTDILLWTNVPEAQWPVIRKSVRLSSFKILYLRAKKFAKEVFVGNESQGVFAFAVGDAAMDVHFFSGTGVNMGFKSSMILADILGQSTTSPHYQLGGTTPDDGHYEQHVHAEAVAFSNQVHPNNDATTAKHNFITYTQSVPHNPLTWRTLDILAKEYHELMQVYMLHKHMDNSYLALHSLTYQYPNCTGGGRNTCYPCEAMDNPPGTCPRGLVGGAPPICLEPVGGGTVLTTNQRRILEHIKDFGHNLAAPFEPHRSTLCALHEVYG